MNAADGQLKKYNIEFLHSQSFSFMSLGGRRHQDGRKDQKSKDQEDEMSFQRKPQTFIRHLVLSVPLVRQCNPNANFKESSLEMIPLTWSSDSVSELF